MSSRFFGQYLLEKGRITSQQLTAAVEHQNTTVAPIGALALESSMLTADQLDKLLDHQRKVNRNFADLALSMGFLTPSQINQLQTRGNRRALLGEALIAKGYLTAAVLERELLEYKKEEQRVAADISTAFNQLLHKDIVRAFTDLVIVMFTQFANQTVKIEQCETGKDKVRLFRWVVCQKIAGDSMEFNCLLSIPAKLVLQMASTMLGEPVGKTDELALDATKEFVNVANGNACVKLSESGVTLSIRPPEIYETTTRPYCLNGKEFVCVHLACPESKLEVAFEF